MILKCLGVFLLSYWAGGIVIYWVVLFASNPQIRIDILGYIVTGMLPFCLLSVYLYVQYRQRYKTLFSYLAWTLTCSFLSAIYVAIMYPSYNTQSEEIITLIISIFIGIGAGAFGAYITNKPKNSATV